MNKVLYIIVNAGFSEEAVQITRLCGARGATVINARGTGASLQIDKAIHYEPEKEIIISIVEEEVAIAIMKEIKKTSGTDTPANGICYCMTADHVSFINKIELSEEELAAAASENPDADQNLSKEDKKRLKIALKEEKKRAKEQAIAEKAKAKEDAVSQKKEV